MSAGNVCCDFIRSRKKARLQRLSRFRTTAVPTERGMVHPQRICPSGFAIKLIRSHSHGRTRRPFFCKFRNSLRRRRTIRRDLLSTHSNRQTFTALIAAASQNLASIFCGHASTETMCRFATTATGLIGAFHEDLKLVSGYDRLNTSSPG